MNDLEKEIKKLSRLTQYKKADKSSLLEIAQKNVWLRQIDIAQRFTSDKDKKMACEVFENYLNTYSFTSFADIETVADLVFEEVTKLKIQQQISDLAADNTNKFLPDRLIESLHKVEEIIWSLKEKAGIVGKKEQDELSALEELKKKFKVYLNFNRNEFTLWSPVICKKCGEKDIQPILLRRRVKDFKALKHPFFSGRFLFNIAIMDDVEKEIITKEQAAKYLQTSVKYIEWAIKNRYKIVEIDNVPKEEVDEFIDDKPYLGKSIEKLK